MLHGCKKIIILMLWVLSFSFNTAFAAEDLPSSLEPVKLPAPEVQDVAIPNAQAAHAEAPKDTTSPTAHTHPVVETTPYVTPEMLKSETVNSHPETPQSIPPQAVPPLTEPVLSNDLGNVPPGDIKLGWSTFSESKEMIFAMILSLMITVGFVRLMIGTIFDFVNLVFSKRPSFNIDRIVSAALFVLMMHHFLKNATPEIDQYRFFMTLSVISLALFYLCDFIFNGFSERKKEKAKVQAQAQAQLKDIDKSK